MALPNWGAYVAGEDLLGYYAQIKADTAAAQVYAFTQKVSNPEHENKFKAAILNTITGAEFRGDTTQGGPNKVAGKANIPNSLPGGYTP